MLHRLGAGQEGGCKCCLSPCGVSLGLLGWGQETLGNLDKGPVEESCELRQSIVLRVCLEDRPCDRRQCPKCVTLSGPETEPLSILLGTASPFELLLSQMPLSSVSVPVHHG